MTSISGVHAFYCTGIESRDAIERLPSDAATLVERRQWTGYDSPHYDSHAVFLEPPRIVDIRVVDNRIDLLRRLLLRLLDVRVLDRQVPYIDIVTDRDNDIVL